MKVKVTSSELVGVIRAVTRRAGFDLADREAILARNAVAATLRAKDRNAVDRGTAFESLFEAIGEAAGEDLASDMITDLDALGLLLGDPETARTLSVIDRLRSAHRRYYPHREDLGIIIRALELSRDILAIEPMLLPQQLLARLVRGDGPAIAALLAQARRRLGKPALIPLAATLSRPAGALRSSLAIEGSRLTAVVMVNGLAQVAMADDEHIVLCDLLEGTTKVCAAHGGDVTCLIYEPSRGLVIAAHRSGPILAWRLDGTPCCELGGHERATLGLAVTPAGDLLSGGTDGALHLWDLDAGCLRRAVIASGPSIEALAVVRDGRVIIGGDFARERHHVLHVLYPDRPELRDELGDYEWPVHALAVTDDARTVIAVANEMLSAWDLETKTLRFALRHAGRIRSVAAALGSRLAVATAFGEALVCDLASGTWRAHLRGHHDDVGSSAIAPDGTTCVSVSRDQTVKVWDLGAAMREAHDGPVTALAFTADGHQIVSGGQDGRLCIWNCRTRRLVRAVAAHGHWVRGIAVVPRTRLVVSAAWDGVVRWWRTDATDPVGEWQMSRTGDDPLRAFALSPSGGWAAIGRSRGAVERLRLRRSNRCATVAASGMLHASVGDVHALAITRAGDLLVGGSRGLLRWPGFTGSEPAPAGAPIEPALLPSVEALCVVARQALVATGEGRVVALDLRAVPAVVATWQASATCNASAISPAGAAVAIATGRPHYASDNTLRIWDGSTAIAQFRGEHPMTACAASRDGSLVVCGDAAGRVHFLRLTR